MTKYSTIQYSMLQDTTGQDRTGQDRPDDRTRERTEDRTDDLICGRRFRLQVVKIWRANLFWMT